MAEWSKLEVLFPTWVKAVGYRSRRNTVMATSGTITYSDRLAEFTILASDSTWNYATGVPLYAMGKAHL